MPNMHRGHDGNSERAGIRETSNPASGTETQRRLFEDSYSKPGDSTSAQARSAGDSTTAPARPGCTSRESEISVTGSLEIPSLWGSRSGASQQRAFGLGFSFKSTTKEGEGC